MSANELDIPRKHGLAFRDPVHPELGWRRTTARYRTTCAAAHGAPALEPVGNYAFMYEASDICPGITIAEFRSLRSGNRRKRRPHVWLWELLSRGQRRNVRESMSGDVPDVRRAGRAEHVL